jgi:hypothetical protein
MNCQHTGQNRHSTTLPIVVAVIGLLVIIAIAIPSFFKPRHKSAQQACIDALRIIDRGKEQQAMAFRATNAASSSFKKIEMHYGDEYTGENTPKENSTTTAQLPSPATIIHTNRVIHGGVIYVPGKGSTVEPDPNKRIEDMALIDDMPRQTKP